LLACEANEVSAFSAISVRTDDHLSSVPSTNPIIVAVAIHKRKKEREREREGEGERGRERKRMREMTGESCP